MDYKQLKKQLAEQKIIITGDVENALRNLNRGFIPNKKRRK